MEGRKGGGGRKMMIYGNRKTSFDLGLNIGHNNMSNILIFVLFKSI